MTTTNYFRKAALCAIIPIGLLALPVLHAENTGEDIFNGNAPAPAPVETHPAATTTPAAAPAPSPTPSLQPSYRMTPTGLQEMESTPNNTQLVRTALKSHPQDDRAAMAAGLADPTLDRVVPLYKPRHQDIQEALYALEETYGINIVPDKDLKGTANNYMTDVTLRQILDSLTHPYGFYWQKVGGIFYIKHYQTKIYHINYPRITTTGNSNSSISLSPSNGSSSGSGGTATGTNVTNNSGSSSGNNNSSGGGGSNDSTNVTITNSITGSVWDKLEEDLKTQCDDEGEKVNLDKFTGLLYVRACPEHMQSVDTYVTNLNQRINQPVKIEAKIYTIALDNQHAMGVDWSLVQRQLGGVTLNSAQTTTALASGLAEGVQMASNTITATLTRSGIQAVVTALQEQGQMHSVSNPSLDTINNQPATIKVGTQETFFSTSSTYSLNQTTATTPTSSSQVVYQQNAVTFGTIMSVTPTINDDGTITLSVLPAITSLAGVDSSPDGTQTAPRTDIKTATTIVNVRPGQTEMIGGLIFTSSSKQTNSIPILGSIPLIGKAFQSSGEISQRNETIIFLTVTAIGDRSLALQP